MVLFIGIQGSGKSRFYRERFYHTHVRINRDMLRTRRREELLIGACLEGGQSFVVDNTNATRAVRAGYIAQARAAKFRVTGYYFDCPVSEALRRNSQRPEDQRVPNVAIFGTKAKLEIPEKNEGFDELYVVRPAENDFAIEPVQ